MFRGQEIREARRFIVLTASSSVPAAVATKPEIKAF